MGHNNDRDSQARRLARVIVARHDEAECAACLDSLEAYITAQLVSEDYLARFPGVAEHLDSCVACAESYAALYEARLAGDRLPEPPAYPDPDLSFLSAGEHAPAAEAGARLRQLLEGAVQRTGARLRLTLSQALLDLLPPPTAAPAMRSGTRAPLFELEVEQPDAVVARLRLTAYSASSAGLADVGVGVGLRDRDWPDLAGTPVTLIIGAERRRALSDAWGEVFFAGVPAEALPELQIEVDAGAAPPITT